MKKNSPMGRNECRLKRQIIFGNNMLVTHVQKAFGLLGCLCWLVLVGIWALSNAQGCSWLWGHTGHDVCTALGAFRAFELWSNPWL